MFLSKLRFIPIALIAILALSAVSCLDDLNTSPIDEDVVTSETVYEDPEDFRQVLAKLYAGFAATGQQGPAGDADIQGIDEGFSSYIRQLWVAQVISTDEAVVGWNDPGLPDFNYQTWGASNDFVLGMYSRAFYEVALTNEFIRNAEDREEESIQQYAAEARFLRALSYWHVLDMFGGNIPFSTDDDPVGADPAEPTNAEDLFEFIESELLDIEDDLPAPGQNEYARADRGAAWTLLTKLYLNAETYIGEDRYDDAVTYADRVIEDGGYSLEEDYENLFLADNDEADGIIFPIAFDGKNTPTYGGTNFIIHAQLGGSMDAGEYGMDSGWEGHRVTPEFVDKFDEDNDGRAMFHTDGQTREIDDISDFSNGYAVTKWKNVDRDGNPGSDLEFADTDFPMFRLADVYLMYAEATERGGGGDESKAVSLINDLRERAYGDNSGDITAGDMDLDFILDERARELYWEGHRRTDLVRYGYFTSDDYVWSWKGEEQEGTATDERNVIFPIPSSDINSNPNLEQNPGY